MPTHGEYKGSAGEDNYLVNVKLKKGVVTSAGWWNVSKVVKLDSPMLSSLVKHLSGDKEAVIFGGSLIHLEGDDDVVPSGLPEDWDMDEYL
jgi:hypothetical protein